MLDTKELNKLEAEGYSCGDCENLQTCRSLGMKEFSFICYSFKNDSVIMLSKVITKAKDNK